MTLLIVIDQRYWRTPDGAVWTRMPPEHSFFVRHLERFDDVRVLARTIPVAEPPSRAMRVDGEGVAVLSAPAYSGPASYARKWMATAIAAKAAVAGVGAVILRGPSQLANATSRFLGSTPYAVEVLADPKDLYSGPLAKLYAAWFDGQLRRQVMGCTVAGHVSQALARRYPGPANFRMLDIRLDEAAFGPPRTAPPCGGLRKIVSVGGFDYPVKGHDLLIRALAGLPDVELTICGGGRLQEHLASLADANGVRLKFAGELPGPEAVRQVVRQANIFVLASRSEGKPRALLEAMALGVPAVASSVGGIPELLPERQLFPREDVPLLRARITRLLTSPDAYTAASASGIETAKAYRPETLHRERLRFLDHLADAVRRRQNLYRTKEAYAR